MVHRSHAIAASGASQKLRVSLERELKLSVDRRFRLPDLPGDLLPPRVLTSTYYDTASYRLAGVGITLRRRVEKGVGTWQLKVPAGKARQEIEMPNGSREVPPHLRDLLFVHLRGDMVAPVAKLRTWRSGIRVNGVDGPVADIVLDAVSVLDPEHHKVLKHFREVEIEQYGSDLSMLAQLEQRLRDAGASDHDGRPKLFRALDLPAAGQPPRPPGDAPTVELLQFVLKSQVEALLAHDPGTRLNVAIESLHQMRVATRRIRAMLRAARPLLVPGWVASLRSELAWLGQLLGPARDLDVQIEYFQVETEHAEPRDRKPLAGFLRHLRKQRELVQRELLAGLKTERYLQVASRLEEAARQPQVVASALSLRDVAAGEFKKLRKAIRRLGDRPGDTDLHRLRIEAKRVRYAAELAEGIAGKAVSRFIQRAKRLQNLLGVHQDAVMAEGQVRSFLEHARGVRAAFAAGRMVERQRQRKVEVRAELPRVIKKLLKCGKEVWG